MITYKTIKTKISEIEIDEEGILHLRVKAGAEMDEEEVMQCFGAYAKLGCKENKVLQLIDGRAGFTMTREARTYAANQGKDFFIASAIVNNSFSARLLVNFFNSFYKHGVPFRIFSNEEDALQWLRKFVEIKNNIHTNLPTFLYAYFVSSGLFKEPLIFSGLPIL